MGLPSQLDQVLHPKKVLFTDLSLDDQAATVAEILSVLYGDLRYYPAFTPFREGFSRETKVVANTVHQVVTGPTYPEGFCSDTPCAEIMEFPEEYPPGKTGFGAQRLAIGQKKTRKRLFLTRNGRWVLWTAPYTLHGIGGRDERTLQFESYRSVIEYVGDDLRSILSEEPRRGRRIITKLITLGDQAVEQREHRLNDLQGNLANARLIEGCLA